MKFDLFDVLNHSSADMGGIDPLFNNTYPRVFIHFEVTNNDGNVNKPILEIRIARKDNEIIKCSIFWKYWLQNSGFYNKFGILYNNFKFGGLGTSEYHVYFKIIILIY